MKGGISNLALSSPLCESLSATNWSAVSLAIVLHQGYPTWCLPPSISPPSMVSGQSLWELYPSSIWTAPHCLLLIYMLSP